MPGLESSALRSFSSLTASETDLMTCRVAVSTTLNRPALRAASTRLPKNLRATLADGDPRIVDDQNAFFEVRHG
jgi:hypothetical protein